MSEMFHELYPITRSLDAAAMRHQVIAGNLANINTPGYVRSDVKFESLLREQLGDSPTEDRVMEAMRSTNAKVVKDKTGPFNPDGSNVTLEREMGQLSRNEILFNAYAEIMSLKISQLKFVISNVK